MTYDDWKLDNGEPAMVDREAEERQALIDAIEASDVVSEACKASVLRAEALGVEIEIEPDAVTASELDGEVTAVLTIHIEVLAESLGDFFNAVSLACLGLWPETTDHSRPSKGEEQ